MEEKSKSRKISWFIFAVCVIAVYKLLDNFGEITEWIKGLASVLMPFFMAVLLAYLFYLPCTKFETLFYKSRIKFIKKRARWLSILTVYVLVAVLIVLVVKFVVPALYESLSELVTALPGYYNSVKENLSSLPEDSVFNAENVRRIIESLEQIDLSEYLNIEKLTEYAINLLGVVMVVFDVFVTVVVSIYILAERHEIVMFARKVCGALFQESTYKSIGKYFRESNAIFFRFISSQLLDGIIVGALTSFAMSLLGVKYAVLLGFFIGLFNMIPYLGAIIAVTISAIITIFTGGLSQAVWMLVVVIVLQQIDANIINPKIIGSSLKISPILIIFSVTVIGSYFGIIGMFLAVPIVAMLKIFVQDFIAYKERKRLQGNILNYERNGKNE